LKRIANGGAIEDTEAEGAEGGRGAWYVASSHAPALYDKRNVNNT
jgi:hypothetical protein